MKLRRHIRLEHPTEYYRELEERYVGPAEAAAPLFADKKEIRMARLEAGFCHTNSQRN